MWKHWIRRWLADAGYVVFNTRSTSEYARDGLFTSHNARFLTDPEFREAYERGVAAGSGVDPRMEWRVHVALWLAQQARRLDGDFVECGVNSGFVSSAIMRRLDWSRLPKTFFLIDTFEGPVVSQYSEEEIRNGRRRVAEEALARGSYVTDLREVERKFAEWPNARVVKGAVPGVLASLEVDRVAFLHLDMNCAYPECAALEHFWDKLTPGGIVLLDDYAYYGNEHLAEEIDRVARRLGIGMLALPTGQGVLMK